MKCKYLITYGDLLLLPIAWLLPSYLPIDIIGDYRMADVLSVTFDGVQRQWNGNYVIVVEDKKTGFVVAALNAVVDRKFNHQMESTVTVMDMLIVGRHQTSAMINL